jgi:hypothetical protein
MQTLNSPTGCGRLTLACEKAYYCLLQAYFDLQFFVNKLTQGCGSGSGLDPDAVTSRIRIRIRIGNPDPGSGFRNKKIKKFQLKIALFSYF